MLTIIPGPQLDWSAWDACVAASPQRVMYGYSWYLNTVLPAPDWKWVGIVQTDVAGNYLAVMPVPLRRKTVAGLTYEWVVHQPLFCQFLGVFSPDPLLNPNPFFELMIKQFRYGSLICTQHRMASQHGVHSIVPQSTQMLNLSTSYSRIYQGYTYDRKVNLRRAQAKEWTVMNSTDPEPLVELFRANHAGTIPGGVKDWAYAIFRKLVAELSSRGFLTLRYALQQGQVEAGALFVQEGNRIIYLFNAASKLGRQGNARTLLIDQLIQEKAGQQLIVDFESPEKPGIRNFYQSFGAVPTTYWAMRWNRLYPAERMIVTLRNQLMNLF